MCVCVCVCVCVCQYNPVVIEAESCDLHVIVLEGTARSSVFLFTRRLRGPDGSRTYCRNASGVCGVLMTFVMSLESCEIQLVWEVSVLGFAEAALSSHAMNMAACG